MRAAPAQPLPTAAATFASAAPTLVAILVACALLGGCASSPGDDRRCPAIDTVARVTAIDGTTVRVQLIDSSQGGEAVLHTEGAAFHYLAASTDDCFEASRSDLAVGQEVQFRAGAWMESKPPQARVDDIVILG